MHACIVRVSVCACVHATHNLKDDVLAWGLKMRQPGVPGGPRDVLRWPALVGAVVAPGEGEAAPVLLLFPLAPSLPTAGLCLQTQPGLGGFCAGGWASGYLDSVIWAVLRTSSVRRRQILLSPCLAPWSLLSPKLWRLYPPTSCCPGGRP